MSILRHLVRVKVSKLLCFLLVVRPILMLRLMNWKNLAILLLRGDFIETCAVYKHKRCDMLFIPLSVGVSACCKFEHIMIWIKSWYW